MFGIKGRSQSVNKAPLNGDSVLTPGQESKRKNTVLMVGIFYLVFSLNLSKTCPNYYTLYSTPHTKDQNIIVVIIIVFLSLAVNRLAWPVITTGLSLKAELV